MRSARKNSHRTLRLAGVESLEIRRLLDGDGMTDPSAEESSEQRLAGDLDNDGLVGFPDFLILAANFGKEAAAADGDIDGDGFVGFPDFLLLAKDFGKQVESDPPDDPSDEPVRETRKPRVHAKFSRFIQKHSDFQKTINHARVDGALHFVDVPATTQVVYYPVLQAGLPTETPPDSPSNRIDPNTSSSPFSGVGSVEVVDPTLGTFLCTGTVISATQVLTAAHCFDPDADGAIDTGVAATFFLNDGSDFSSTHIASQISIHPGFEGFSQNPHDDLAIVELQEAVPSSTQTYRISPSGMDNGQVLELVGYGLSGNGETGYTVDPTFTTKRTGGNNAELFISDDDGDLTDEIFIFDFDGPAGQADGFLGGTTLGNDVETTIGGGDSGGPAFIDVNGEKVIAGINSFNWELIGITAEPGFFGSLAGGTMTGSYIDWLASVAPNSILNNAAPTFTPGGDVVVLEDSGSQEIAWATDISAGEPDQNVDFHVVAISNAELFDELPTVDSEGVLHFTMKPNVNGVADVTVELQDDGGTAFGGVDTSGEQTFSITVSPVNDQPSFSILGDVVVKQAAQEQNIADFATGFEPGPLEIDQVIAEFLTANDNAQLFTTQPSIDSSGRLTFAIDGSIAGDATVDIRVRDDGGTANGGVDLSEVQSFVISVEGDVAPPVEPGDLDFKLAGEVVVNEDAGKQRIAGFASNIGPAVAAFVVKNDNEALFKSQPTIGRKGQLRFKAAADAFGTATVSVRAVRADRSTSESQEFEISVLAVNDAPVISIAGDIEIEIVRNNDQFKAWLDVKRRDDSTRDDDGDNRGDEDPTRDDDDDDDDENENENRENDVDDQGTDDEKWEDDDQPRDKADARPNRDDVIEIHATLDGGLTFKIDDFIARFDSGSKLEKQRALEYLIKHDNADLFEVAPTIDLSGSLSFRLAKHARGVAHLRVVGRDDGGTENGGIDTSAAVSFTIRVANGNAIDSTIMALAKKFRSRVEELENEAVAAQLLRGMNRVIESIDDDFLPARNRLQALNRIIRALVQSKRLSEEDGKSLLEITQRMLKYFDSQSDN